MRFYINKIEKINKIYSITDSLNEKYFPCNPSILKRDYGYLLNKFIDTNIIYEQKNSKLNLTGFKGSAPPLKMDDGNYLSVIHETIVINYKYYYIHRYLLYDSNLTKIIKLSLPFYFEHLGFKFCRSICYGHNNNIILGVGIKDKQANLYSQNINDIYNILIDLDKYIL